MKEYACKNTFNFVEMIRNLLNVLFNSKKTQLKKEQKRKALKQSGDRDDYLFLVEDMQNNIDVLRCVSNLHSGLSNFKFRDMLSKS
jgi:hypothetical protein